MDANFYLDFENNFRGSRDQIRDILTNYDGLIQYVLETDQNPTLLDIGCGRGEWLQKCLKLGFHSSGIELNPEMALICKEMGFEILEGDAINLLKNLPDNSFSLITAFHIIEHLSFESIEVLLIECKRLLKGNGLLVLETPSIDNLSISSSSFYIDPTHITPINPDLLVFSLGRIGFEMTKIFYINGGPLQDEDKYSLTRIFNGVAQDLSLIATKSKKSSLQLNKDKSWQKSFKTGLTTIQASVEFDHQLRLKLVNNEEQLSHLRSRIFQLENNLEDITNNYLFEMIKNTSDYLMIARNLFIIFKQFIYKFIYKITNLIIKVFFKIMYKIFPKNNQIFYFLCRLIDKIFRTFGYRVKYGKLLKKTLRVKEDSESVCFDEKNLEDHFHLSSTSKTIYNELK